MVRQPQVALPLPWHSPDRWPLCWHLAVHSAVLPGQPQDCDPRASTEEKNMKSLLPLMEKVYDRRKTVTIRNDRKGKIHAEND